MKSPDKLKDTRAATRVTRAGHGGRKQAQTGNAADALRVEEAEAGIAGPIHPSRMRARQQRPRGVRPLVPGRAGV